MLAHIAWSMLAGHAATLEETSAVAALIGAVLLILFAVLPGLTHGG